MRPLKASLLGFGSASLTAVLGIVAALIALRQVTSGGAWRAPEWVPLAFAAVGVAVFLVVVAALVHVLLRRDLSRSGKAVLAIGSVLIPGGGVIYFALGRDRTRGVAEQVVRFLDGVGGGEPRAS